MACCWRQGAGGERRREAAKKRKKELVFMQIDDTIVNMHKIDREIGAYCRKKLGRSYPVVFITGPRQSGKTTFCRKHYKSLPYVNLEELQVRERAKLDPWSLIKQHPEGAVLDEIQRVPSLCSQLQAHVDAEDFKGLFVLTGSHNFSIMSAVSQSLAGRAAWLQLLPFSFSEISHYTDTGDLDELLYRGFYPRISHRRLEPAKALSDYISTYIERDLRQLKLIKNLSAFQMFLKLMAGRTGQLLNFSSLSNDVGVSVSTIREWTSLLEASYIIFKLPPFFENIGKRLIKQPKLYFYDVGLACSLLGIEEKKHLQAHPLRGHLFENLVVAEMAKRRFNAGKNLNFYFYRDSSQTEIDLLIPRQGKYDLIEIKSAARRSSSFQKPFKSFQKAGGKIRSAFLVYTGAEEYSDGFLSLLNYQNLHKIRT